MSEYVALKVLINPHDAADFVAALNRALWIALEFADEEEELSDVGQLQWLLGRFREQLRNSENAEISPR